MHQPIRAHWGSRLSFVLATAGSAIGLGNIWKFPYIAGVNGGGAFVLVYLLCIALVGIPIFIAELYIGQQAQTDAVDAFSVLHKKSLFWRLPGWLGLISAFLILSFYSVVGGWILDFEFRSLINEISNQPITEVKGLLNSLLANPLRQIMWHFIFLGLTTSIVLKGIREGLEKWNKILMPLLLIILLALLTYSFFLEGFTKALSFLFSFNTSQLTSAGLLEAIGHSFFTLSLGMGAIITYGSYLSKKENLVKIAFTVAFLDTSIALIAGLIIFSIVFTFGIEPGSGPGLIFSTLPTLFAQMPGGYFLSVIFFMLVTFAAITSAVSILEVVVTYLSDNHGFSRKKATLTTSSSIFLLGLLSVFSTNVLSHFKIFNHSFFDLFDKITSSYFLPIGGMLISLFLGWVLGPKACENIFRGNKRAAKGLLFLSRFVAPIAVLGILYNQVIGF